MINFDDEIKNFDLSPELDGVEEAAQSRDLTDVTDVLLISGEKIQQKI